VDSWQRNILFWEVMRERGNQFVEHERAGKPPVLVFEYDVVMDARQFDKPANYALVRIKPPEGSEPDARKRPFVVIDPRAGHGPGIGGSKLDSEIGVALKNGHPCYFVMFFPEPVPGQTIESVARAEAKFLEKVNQLHPEANGKPFVIGNCQGGWALLMLSAAAPHLVGPILLAGSPISYWAGVEGKNPMRYSGGLLGGSWLASLAGDLGHGKFDGAALVQNFEQLNPSNTYFTKSYNLYSKIDTEPERFLDFEKWWGGHFLLNKEEMEWIVQNLFVGNKLSSGEIANSEGNLTIDLRNIRSPIVVFASWGDNITPPQQALNWIPDLYSSVDEIRANEQTIVYCLNEKIGHLGIFVSTKVAQKETAELVDTLDLIDILPPGLYEAIIEDKNPDTPNAELVGGRFLIRFEPRTVQDILALDDGREDERAFEVVKRVAEINQGLYDTFVSPVVKAMSNETMAEWLRVTNPTRLERYVLSDLNPAMWTIKTLAQMVKAQRKPVGADNPFVKQEKQAAGQIEKALDDYRDKRDAAQEKLFKMIYESPWMAALVGLAGKTDPRRAPRPAAALREELHRLKIRELESQMDEGTLLDGWLRILVYQGREEKVIDERPFQLLRRLSQDMPADKRPGITKLKEAVKRQAFIMLLDEERALRALPKLLPDMSERRKAVEVVRKVAGAKGALSPAQERRWRRIEDVLGIESPRENLKAV
jgi:pimeloyl-ACP methyl ester carboxylesterase